MVLKFVDKLMLKLLVAKMDVFYALREGYNNIETHIAHGRPNGTKRLLLVGQHKEIV